MRMIDADDFKQNAVRMLVLMSRAHNCNAETALRVLDLIDTQPTINAEPVRYGKWVEGRTEVTCSVCDSEWSCYDNDTDEFSYCPNCGAKMYGKEEAE